MVWFGKQTGEAGGREGFDAPPNSISPAFAVAVGLFKSQSKGKLVMALNDYLAFKKSSIQGLGVFARVDLPTGFAVLEYVGERITKQESLRRCEEANVYIFALDDEFDLDGNVGWNPAKFVNHSCSPNCEAQFIDGRIWIVSLRPISAGEEITFNYGYDLEEYRDHPCSCGSPECVGYIVAEEFFEHVKKLKETLPQQH